MFIWRLWGNVFAVGNSGDFLTYLIIQIIWISFLVMLTIAILVPVLAFMAIRAGFRWYAERPLAIAGGSSGLVELPSSDPSVESDACSYCGNTASRDIRPCIRCGN